MNKLVKETICSINDAKPIELVINAEESCVKGYHIQLADNQAILDKKLSIKLVGSDAYAKIIIYCYAKGTQKINLVIGQEHSSHNGISDVLVKALLDDRATFDCTCSINIHALTHQNKAKLSVKTILLSDAARTMLRPELEILSDDAECKHSASCENLSEESLFYLQNRGITLAAAKNILLQGFLNESKNL